MFPRILNYSRLQIQSTWDICEGLCLMELTLHLILTKLKLLEAAAVTNVETLVTFSSQSVRIKTQWCIGTNNDAYFIVSAMWLKWIKVPWVSWLNTSHYQAYFCIFVGLFSSGIDLLSFFSVYTVFINQSDVGLPL